MRHFSKGINLFIIQRAGLCTEVNEGAGLHLCKFYSELWSLNAMEHPTQPTSSLFKHPFASSRHPQESQTLETPGNFRLIAFILVKLIIRH